MCIFCDNNYKINIKNIKYSGKDLCNKGCEHLSSLINLNTLYLNNII